MNRIENKWIFLNFNIGNKIKITINFAEKQNRLLKLYIYCIYIYIYIYIYIQ